MKDYQREALKLAKNSILEEFQKADLNNYYPETGELLEEKACFVTLKKGDTNR
jgi:AMMECR1 domain-containing protein